jgi:hypothetical protein
VPKYVAKDIFIKHVYAVMSSSSPCLQWSSFRTERWSKAKISKLARNYIVTKKLLKIKNYNYKLYH